METDAVKIKSKYGERTLSISETPTSLTDIVQVAKRKDGSVLLRLLSVTPDLMYENHRTVICKNEIISLIDGLCSILKYYPKKPLPKKKPKKKIE